MKNLKSFLQKHNKNYIAKVKINDDLIKKFNLFYKLVSKTKKNKKKIIIAGNGGSAAIASHFSVDITKNGNIRCINFNESDLLTCFANDYGYENWLKQALKFYLDSGDLVILISASGNSKNIINAAKFTKMRKNKLVTLTGFNGKNLVNKFGNLNFAVNSKNYNLIENVHQYLLLLAIDLINHMQNNKN